MTKKRLLKDAFLTYSPFGSHFYVHKKHSSNGEQYLLLPAFPLLIITSYTLRNKAHRYRHTQTKIKASGESPFIPRSHSCERLWSMHTPLPSVLMGKDYIPETVSFYFSLHCVMCLKLFLFIYIFFNSAFSFLCIPCMIQRDYETDRLWDNVLG